MSTLTYSKELTVTERAIWPMTLIVCIVFAVAGGLLALHVDVVAIIAVFASVAATLGSIFGLLLYGKMQQIEKNTNGASTQDKMMIQGLVEYVKNSQPVTKE